jgi:hypothetical protein
MSTQQLGTVLTVCFFGVLAVLLFAPWGRWRRWDTARRRTLWFIFAMWLLGTVSGWVHPAPPRPVSAVACPQNDPLGILPGAPKGCKAAAGGDGYDPLHILPERKP